MTDAILVTGADGFVGRHLMKRLRQVWPLGHVTGASRRAVAGLERLDVTSREAIDGMVAALRPSAVVHLAAMSSISGCEADPVMAYQVNVMSSLHLARALLAHAPGAHLVFISSSEVYGGSFRSGVRLNEQTPIDPLNIYAATKASGELLMSSFVHQGLRVTRFRPFNHFGPGQSERFVLASFAQQIAAAECGRQPPILRTGDLSSRRDFLDVRDVVQAYVAALQQPSALPEGAILNVASGVPRRIGDILEELIGLARIPLQVEEESSRMRARDIPEASGDASRLRAQLGWDPTYSFSTTLRDLMDYERMRLSGSR